MGPVRDLQEPPATLLTSLASLTSPVTSDVAAGVREAELLSLSRPRLREGDGRLDGQDAIGAQLRADGVRVHLVCKTTPLNLICFAKKLDSL